MRESSRRVGGLLGLAFLSLLSVERGVNAQAQTTQDPVFRFNDGGLARQYRVHLPPGMRADQPLPLVLALHGGGGSMDFMAQDTYGLRQKADQAGFVVAFANGSSPLPSGRLATWNAGNCCGRARDMQTDDVGYLREVVRRIQNTYPIDPKRIYAVGMSNGGMMAYRLACDAADIFSGIMSVAGTDNTGQCHPSRPIRVLHIHALNDDHVPFNGGIGSASAREELITNFKSVPATIEQWVRLDHASPQPTRVLQVGGAHCDLYPPQSGGAPVQLCVTDSGGHSWPGGGKQAASQAIRANDLMWAFFNAP